MDRLVTILVILVVGVVGVVTVQGGVVSNNSNQCRISNATFCSSPSNNNIPMKTCCTDQDVTRETEFKRRLNIVMATKFAAMREGLKRGQGVVLKAITTCSSSPQNSTHSNNNNTKPLLTTTANSLATMATVDWSRLFRYDSNTECKVKVARAYLCGDYCLQPPEKPLPPCPTLCMNLLHGCFSNLANQILLPWKHGVSALRSALRLVLTQCENPDLDALQREIADWREVFVWVDGGVCSGSVGGGLGGGAGGGVNDDCWGGDVDPVEGTPTPTRRYGKPMSPWLHQKSNPEFMQLDSRLISSLEYDAELSVVREGLERVAMDLQKYYPTQVATATSSHQSDVGNHGNSNNQQSMQSDESSFEYLESSEDDEYDDDEDDDDDEFSGSGVGHFSIHGNGHFQTDDEDLLDNEDGGSGFYGNKRLDEDDDDFSSSTLLPTTIRTVTTTKSVDRTKSNANAIFISRTIIVLVSIVNFINNF